MSNVFYYQADLDSLFTAFFRGQQTSKKTQVNYKSDIRTFFDWLLALFQKLNIKTTGINDLLCLTTYKQLDLYKHEMIESGTPTATINRRLSAIRKFFQSMNVLGYITNNPTEQVNNVSVEKHRNESVLSILGDFEQALIRQGAAATTVKQYVSDIEHLLQWLTKQASS